jgi:hypothetical protein
MILDLSQAPAWIALLSFLGSIGVLAMSVAFRFKRLETQAKQTEQDTGMILKALFACLDGLRQVGANGEVTKMLQNLQDYTATRR